MSVDQYCIGGIGAGFLVLPGLKADDESSAQKLTDKVLSYRVFSDADGKMNLNLGQVEGEVLIVPQFTLIIDVQVCFCAHPVSGNVAPMKILIAYDVNIPKREQSYQSTHKQI